ncbi:MAG: Ig-like domain repeat protein, partial [Eubacterium sp.]|nr:Ig-like domain repeat protein [Eubacterium sp.]
SGVKSITYYTVDKDGVKSEEKTELVNKDNQITFTVKANFKGQIYAKACDNVGHTPSTFSKPNGAVIESPDLHTQTSAIKYTLKDSKDSNGADIKDEKGNNLYGADTTVDVEVADTYSGIRRIDWEIVSPFDDKKQAGTVTVDNNGKVTSVAKKGYSDDCLGDWVATGEANTNLVVNLKNTIKVSNDSNDIKIKFTLTDRAGNVTKDVVQTLSIDKTAPKIAVQMNENDDNEFNGYFKGSREADIYVYERNFSQSDVVFDVKRTDDNNKQTNVSPKPKFKYVGTQVIDGRECFVYKMTTKFKADGDYNFKVSASDITSHIANAESVNFKSDNKSVKFSSDKTAEYTSQNDTDRAIDVSFTIDNTNPVVSVSYDNNTAANEKYFNAYRTATLTVVEHNFSTAASRIIYKRTSAKDGANINEPAVSSWSRKGNTYTATIKYSADGDYTFDMQVIDKAGNKDKGVKYNGAAAKDFTVDTTIAKPSIKGVENGKSYKASVLPSISFNDINIANSEIKLLRTRKNEINKDVTSDFIKISKNAKGGSFKANEETFKKLQENDGIYTLSVNISDKAGNKSSETVKFTVNRFGSVYALNKYLVNDLNNSYVQSIDNNLVITEYNPDKLVKGKLDVVVTRDGSPVDFGDGQLTVNPVVNSTVQIGQSGWYQYNYTISKDLFTDDNGKAIDGIYKIYVASEDEVGNKSENINYKDADIMFRLDTTAPSLKSVAGLEKSVVNAAKLDVNYEIFDSIGLKSIDVYYVNENGIDAVDHIRSKDSKEENVAGYIEDVTSYKGKFTIGECTKENVRFVITDLAGNVTDTGDTNNKAVNFDSSSLDFNSTITVSTNPLTRWYAHTVLFWCSIAVIAVALGAIGFVVATKLRKKEEKATEDYKNSKKNK